MKIYKIIIVLLSLASFSMNVYASSVCGEPPPLSNETLKGELDGKAQFLSKFLGNVDLGGNIETAKHEVISKYPNADTVLLDLYLQYQTCTILMDDNSMSTSEKLKELRNMRKVFLTSNNHQKSAQLSMVRKCANEAGKVKGMIALAESVITKCGVMYKNYSEICINAKKNFDFMYPPSSLDSLESFMKRGRL